jgi:ribosomal protein S4
MVYTVDLESINYGFKSHYLLMIPKLNWNRKNIGKILLFQNLNPFFKPIKKAKNNQFNVKWFFNRFLYSYYQHNSLSFIENRLDLILFRTNWFISYNHVLYAILTGHISLNHVIVRNKNIFIKSGDLLQVKEEFLIWKKKEIIYEPKKIYKSSFRYNAYKNRFRNYMDWFKNKHNFLLKNPVYLEINNNIKSIIVLNNPHYKNIPYPKNLERNLRIWK